MEAATRQHHPQVVVEGAVEAAVIPTVRLAELHKGMRVGGVWAVPLGLAVWGGRCGSRKRLQFAVGSRRHRYNLQQWHSTSTWRRRGRRWIQYSRRSCLLWRRCGWSKQTEVQTQAVEEAEQSQRTAGAMVGQASSLSPTLGKRTEKQMPARHKWRRTLVVSGRSTVKRAPPVGASARSRGSLHLPCGERRAPPVRSRLRTPSGERAPCIERGSTASRRG